MLSIYRLVCRALLHNNEEKEANQVVPGTNALLYSLAAALCLSLFLLARLAWEYAANLKLQQRQDPLTELPNRLGLEAALVRKMAHAEESNSGVAVLFIGLDEFRPVNDLYGHRAGDVFLRQVARRLLACKGPDDVLARVGGDEFMIVTSHDGSRTGISQLADRVLSAVRQCSSVEANRVNVPASIGISLFPDHGRDTLTLIRLADLAMRKSKQRSGDTSSFYDPSMSDAEFRRGEIVAMIRDALNEQRLHLVFQPVLDGGGHIAQLEALVRIHDRLLGSVPPDEFIGVAEQTGLIHEIGAWIFWTVCRQAQQWHEAGFHVPIAVNVSPVQLLADDFVARILAWLEAAELTPEAIIIEVTESEVIHDADVIHALEKLRDAGVRVSIDNFRPDHETGLTRNLPVDSVKIDGSLSEPEYGLLDTVSHAQKLGYEAIVERIEESWQLDGARQAGADLFQGFLIAPPLEPEDTTQFLASHADSSLGAQDSLRRH